MPSRSLRRVLTRIAAPVHFWLSLVVGLQVLAWTISGLFMTASPIERVRSEQRILKPPVVDLAEIGPILSTDAVLKLAGTPLVRLSLDVVGGRAVYVGQTPGDDHVMFDARTGARLSPIAAEFARRIAAERITGGLPARIDWIDKDPPIEFRGDLPVWRLSYADADKLAVYISPETGAVLARRSDLWRAYDFLWSLHIMDYKTRENFNHVPLIAFSAASVLMSLAGLALLVLRLPRHVRRPSVVVGVPPAHSDSVQ